MEERIPGASQIPDSKDPLVCVCVCLPAGLAASFLPPSFNVEEDGFSRVLFPTWPW